MINDSPSSANLSLASASKHVTATLDSNVFYPEVNKIVTVGMVRRKKIWLLCDGKGNMYGRLVDDPIKTLERLNRLKKKGIITEEDYRQVKASLLAQVSD